MKEGKYLKVLNMLQARCSRSECCSRDMRTKALKALDGDEEAAERIVASLVADKFVDDLRYASAFAREKSSLSGWGVQKISFALTGKGIDRQTIAQALKDIDTDAAANKLDSVLAAKLRTLSSDPQRRVKLLRFALGRGYGYDEVKSAVDRLLSEED